MNSRIRTPSHIFFLNPDDYVAARSLRSVCSNYKRVTRMVHQCQKFLQYDNINFFTVKSGLKASVVERFDRT